MFFIMGIYNRSKEIAYNGGMEICPDCGRYCSYNIYAEFMCLSLFFIPVLRWGKRYYAKSSCCGKIHELTKEQSKQAEKGEKITIVKEL